MIWLKFKKKILKITDFHITIFTIKLINQSIDRVRMVRFLMEPLHLFLNHFVKTLLIHFHTALTHRSAS
jgi:hypothetical protein